MLLCHLKTMLGDKLHFFSLPYVIHALNKLATGNQMVSRETHPKSGRTMPLDQPLLEEEHGYVSFEVANGEEAENSPNSKEWWLLCFPSRMYCFLGCLVPTILVILLLVYFLWPRCITAVLIDLQLTKFSLPIPGSIPGAGSGAGKQCAPGTGDGSLIPCIPTRRGRGLLGGGGGGGNSGSRQPQKILYSLLLSAAAVGAAADPSFAMA